MLICYLSILHYTIKLSQVRIGVDLDGVVADFTTGWTTQYFKDFGKKIEESDITEWGLASPLTHFKKEIDFWNWAKDINGNSIFRNLPLYEGAVTTLLEQVHFGHEVIIISSKPWWSMNDTLIWLGENKIPTKEIHFTEEKWKVDCDVYIDDAPHQLKNFTKKTRDKLIIRFVRPYNRPLEGVVDLHKWKDLTSLLESQ